MLNLKPVKLMPVREQAASSIREAIITQSLKPGETLNLESTAKALGISATPVREAFQILARDGLIELSQNRAAVVLGFSESSTSTIIRLPEALISGISSCGGETTTLLVTSSTLIYSSKTIVIFLSVTLTERSCGVVLTMLGGVSSYHPPSGDPMRAQLEIKRNESRMKNVAHRVPIIPLRPIP